MRSPIAKLNRILQKETKKTVIDEAYQGGLVRLAGVWLRASPCRIGADKAKNDFLVHQQEINHVHHEYRVKEICRLIIPLYQFHA